MINKELTLLYVRESDSIESRVP